MKLNADLKSHWGEGHGRQNETKVITNDARDERGGSHPSKMWQSLMLLVFLKLTD